MDSGSDGGTWDCEEVAALWRDAGISFSWNQELLMSFLLRTILLPSNTILAKVAVYFDGGLVQEIRLDSDIQKFASMIKIRRIKEAES